MKKILKITHTDKRHWVGDGFPVRNLFSYAEDAATFSPFLLFDYAGPAQFNPTQERLGVGEHPHRGFETVTIVYEGEVEHRDSSGAGGKIGPGDVQWMTAAGGLVHEEFHGREFAKRGGMFQMVQLWVNLPTKDKMSAPKYQEITNSQIPSVTLDKGAGILRVIAGEFGGAKGPAQTFTPVHLWDVRIQAGQSATLDVPNGYTALLAVLSGKASVNGSEEMSETGLAVFERTGTQIVINAKEESTILILSGEPIDEPVVGRGPFVMNTEKEIQQAIQDYQAGRMGHLSS